MGKCRFVSPDTKRIDLSDGDWIEVKRRLTTEEVERAQDSKRVMAYVAEYLVDWSLRDANDKPVPIPDTTAAKYALLGSLDPEDFNEIDLAVGAHAKSVREADEERKKAQSGKSGEIAVATSTPSAA